MTGCDDDVRRIIDIAHQRHEIVGVRVHCHDEVAPIVAAIRSNSNDIIRHHCIALKLAVYHTLLVTPCCIRLTI